MNVNFSTQGDANWRLEIQAESDAEAETLRLLFVRQPDTLRCSFEQNKGGGLKPYTRLVIYAPQPS